MSKRNRRHVGQWINVDGEPVHVLADPNMSEETREALVALARAARKMVENRKPDMDALKAFEPDAIIDVLEWFLGQWNFDIGMNVEMDSAGWQVPVQYSKLLYALRGAELVEMRDVRDSIGIWTGTEYRITQAGIRYLQEHRP